MAECPMGGYGVKQGENNPLTYNNYLRVKELKELQECKSSPAHHDEPLFIIIHQTYELWFKLILHEIDTIQELLVSGNLAKATFYVERIVAILKVLVQQIHILETMTPKDFLGFRSSLNPASGFQSSQFREVEFAAGLKDERMLAHFKMDEEAYAHLSKRFADPSLQDLFYEHLQTKGFTLANQEESKRLSELKRIYDDPQTFHFEHDLAERLIELDEQIYLWRVHHATVVERIIGHKRGTGGSEGVAYLQSTWTKRCFPDLWNVRTCI